MAAEPDVPVELLREAPIASPRDLWNWLYLFTGIRLANRPVCPEHATPWAAFRELYFREPSQALVVGPRGGGKSFMAALRTHRRSRENPNHKTRILGGSLAQSAQIRDALEIAVRDGRGPWGWSDAESIAQAMVTRIEYRNGAEIEILAASSKSVRGPHVPDLDLDEIDEMDPEIHEAAVGMAMDSARLGFRPDGTWGDTGTRLKSTILMTSTWHRPDGPVGTQLEKAAVLNARRPGAFPVYRFCSFDVLEKCPTELSGERLEKCPVCPLVEWCHDVRDGGPPKAKRGNGHYSIRSLIQKAEAVSRRAFAADYLCRGPKVAGLYFPEFVPDEGGPNVPATGRHGNPAEYNPLLPVTASVDPGYHTGGVLFQMSGGFGQFGSQIRVNVFADYYREGRQAEAAARDIVELSRTRCNGRLDEKFMDPAAKANTMVVGPTALAEYERGGLKGIRLWPAGPGSAAQGLTLLEGLIRSATGRVSLIIHPRCKHLIKALTNYRRDKKGTTWLDHPKDPQHPHEDLVDALRRGIGAP